MKRIEKVSPVPRSKSVQGYSLRLVFLVSAFVLALLLPGTAAAQTGGISGTVADAATSAGLSASVTVYSWNGAFVTSVSTTAGTGAYVVSNLPPGFYFARTFAAANYTDEAYDNVSCESCPITTSAPIAVHSGATTSNINFALSTVAVSAGSVSGTVTDAATAVPIANVQVGIYQMSGTSFVSMAFPFTNASGVYTATGLPAGTYVARSFVSSTSQYLDEGYDNISCSPSCNFTAFTPFTVSDAVPTTNINFPLAAGGGISGTVTNESTAAALASVTVQVYSSTGSFVKSASSNAAGAYSVVGLAPGSYFARTFVPTTLNNVDEAYNNFSCVPSCTLTSSTPITVAGTTTTPNINFALSQGGGIAGAVIDGGTGTPLASVSVQIYTATGTSLKSGSTNAAGEYSVVGLVPGTYFARTFVLSNTNNLDEAYNNVPCTPSCTVTSTTPIIVSGTSTTGGISFVLAGGATISGTVTDARTGAPGPSIGVQIYSSTGLAIKTGFSNASGVYSVTGLPTGTYHARTSLGTTYVSELFNNINCPHNACVVTTGAPIAVTAGATQGGINFPLLPTGAADLAIDFGSLGLWMLSADHTWRPLHSFDPVATTTGDFDGNGADDLLVNFGPGVGVYVWMNHATWVFLHGLSPTQMVTGDLDANGRDEAILAFAGAGVWRWSDGNWFSVHGLTPSRMAVGRIDTVQGDDLVADFPGAGIWMLANNSTWSHLHGLNSLDILTADLNGNGRDEVLINFAGFGVWAYRDGATWSQIHGQSPVRLAAGHLDTGNREDLVIDFGSGVGVWTYRNDATWAHLHAFPTQDILIVDRNASASAEIIIDFGAAGLWQFANTGTWTALHSLSPDVLASGRLR